MSAWPRAAWAFWASWLLRSRVSEAVIRSASLAACSLTAFWAARSAAFSFASASASPCGAGMAKPACSGRWHTGYGSPGSQPSAAWVLPGAEDADVGGVRDADVVTRKSPAAGVAAGLWW